MSVRKSWFWVGQNFCLIFIRFWIKVHLLKYLCRPRWVIVKKPFSDWQYLAAIRRHFMKLSEFAPKIWNFGASKVFLGGTPNVWANNVNLGHHWTTCGKLWWRSIAETPPTRSSATAERQRVSYTRLSRLTHWSCTSLSTASVLQLYKLNSYRHYQPTNRATYAL